MGEGEHRDPEHYRRFGFCRGECKRCEELDREEVEQAYSDNYEE